MKVWTHKTRFKGEMFLGTYEFSRAGKRIFKLKNARTGRESKGYTSCEAAKRDDWR